MLFLFRDRATPVAREEVTTLVPGGGRPGDAGLYLYTTRGFETTDALMGARHDYPAQTYLTIQPGGCGTLVRWQALRERWTEHDYCPDGSLAGSQHFRRWFGVGNLDRWVCSPPISTRGEPGESWEGVCTREAGSNVAAAERVLRHEAVGYETLEVGGEQVETLHLRSRSIGTGASLSEDATETWILPGTLLIVRQTSSISSTTQSRIGSVHYYEEYEITLVSLQPSS